MGGFDGGSGGGLDDGVELLFGVAVVVGWEGAHDVVEGGFDVQYAVGCAGGPGAVWGVWGVGVALGFFFEEGDVVDADGEEGAETGGFVCEEGGDGEGDV